MIGAITISLDFEAGWGVIGNGDWRRREATGVYRELRPALQKFVALLNALEIPCVWAVVGAMIDEQKTRDISHLKGAYAEKARMFLAQSEAATHDGRDLLDIILRARTPQAFGTHGYSHVLFNDMEQDETVYRAELDRARAANKTAGLSSDLLVFPENRIGHLDLVADSGIRVARTPPKNAPTPDERPGVLMRAVGSLLRPVSPVVESNLQNGLRLHSGSELLNWGTYGGYVKAAFVRKRINRAFSAAKAGAHIHFWLHPFDLVATDHLMSFVEVLLPKAARARDSGHIEFRTIQ